MKADKAAMARFGSPFTGVAILKKETVTIPLNPGTYADGTKITRTVSIPGSIAYVSDAQYRLSGAQTEKARPWSLAPRKFYLINEAALPAPRFYLYKKNQSDQVVIECLLYNCQPITKSYTITIDVYIFVSHFL